MKGQEDSNPLTEYRFRFSTERLKKVSLQISKLTRGTTRSARPEETIISTILIPFWDGKSGETNPFRALVNHADYFACGSDPLTGRRIGESKCLSEFSKKIFDLLQREDLLERNPALKEFVDILKSPVADKRILIRISVDQPALGNIPWELISTGNGDHLGTSCRVVREPNDLEATNSVREVTQLSKRFSATLVTAIDDPGGITAQAIEEHLHNYTRDGSRTYLHSSFRIQNISNRLASPRGIPESLRYLDSQLLHIVAHGRVHEGVPQLRLFSKIADGVDAENEAWRNVVSFATLIPQSQVKLVVLHSCLSGATAQPGDKADTQALYSAAEIFIRNGVDAVLAFLCPLGAHHMREFIQAFYEHLLNVDNQGDISLCVQKARNEMKFVHNQYWAFAPVLFLGNVGSQLFDFSYISYKRPPDAPAAPEETALTKDLCVLFSRSPSINLPATPFQRYVAVLGTGSQELEDQIMHSIRESLIEKIAKQPRLNLSKDDLRAFPIHSLAQICQVVCSQSEFTVLVEKEFPGEFEKYLRPPDYVQTMGEFLCPGAHISLYITPHLEWSASLLQPDKAIFVIMSSKKGELGQWACVRRPGDGLKFTPVPIPKLAKDATDEWQDPNAIFLYRLFGGREPNARETIDFRLSEDDRLGLNLHSGVKEHWLIEKLRGALRTIPNLYIEIPALDGYVRFLFRSLRGGEGAPEGSLAVMQDTDSNHDLWNPDRLKNFFGVQIPLHFVSTGNGALASSISCAGVYARAALAK